MIVEEQGIGSWTRVQLPSGPSMKNPCKYWIFPLFTRVFACFERNHTAIGKQSGKTVIRRRKDGADGGKRFFKGEHCKKYFRSGSSHDTGPADQCPLQYCGLNILVREYRCSGGTDTANPAAGNR